MTKHYNYATLLRQRELVAALTLGLVTIMTGVGIELALTSQKTTISDAVQKLITPLDPLLDLKTVEKLESYTFIPLDTAKTKVRQAVASESAQLAPEEGLPGLSATPSPSPSPFVAPAPELTAPATQLIPTTP